MTRRRQQEINDQFTVDADAMTRAMGQDREMRRAREKARYDAHNQACHGGGECDESCEED